MSPQCESDMSARTPVSSVICFTPFLPDFTPGPSDEKNGQLSRQPSTPSRQNSRRSESGSERERGEKERAADGGSSSGSSSGTVLQRRGSGKDKTRLLSSSNGTQSHPWKRMLWKRGEGTSAWPFSLPSLCPSHILFHFLTSCLASYHYSKAMEYLRGSIPLKLILGYDRELPTEAGFSRNVYWRRRQVELISRQPSRAASPQRDEVKDRLSKMSHLTREIQEKFTDRETHSPPAPLNQESTYPSQQPITYKFQIWREISHQSAKMEDTSHQQSPFSHSLLSFSDQPDVTWIADSLQHHLMKYEEPHDRRHALLSSLHFKKKKKCVMTKWGCLLKKQ